MSQRGKPSTAHEYSKSGECIHCGMYRKAVDLLSHNCTPAREARQDTLDRETAAQAALQGIEGEANDHGE